VLWLRSKLFFIFMKIGNTRILVLKVVVWLIMKEELHSR